MTTLWKTGITVGKFSPPHLGHAHLISAAASQVTTLYILLCHKAGQIDPELRAAWLKEVTPANCRYIITPDDLPEAPEPWAKRAQDLINTSIDAAFTSEDYGHTWAQLMGAHHVCIDLHRSTVPISATAIRENPVENFTYLVPAARAALVRRYVLAGAESSGKTTLSKALADTLNTVWVPEYGRLYCEGRGFERSWSAYEFEHIATMQTQMINAIARQCDRAVLIADTDSLVTRVWQQRYTPDSELIELATTADHYFVCEPLAWEQDGTRESEAFRDTMLANTIAFIKATNTPYTFLRGTHKERLTTAMNIIVEQQATL